MATQTVNPELLPSNGNVLGSFRLNSGQRWLLAGVATGGLVVSISLFWILWVQEYQVAEAQFRLEAERRVEAITQALAGRLSIMNLLKSFYAGSVEVDRKEFTTFTASIFKENHDISTLAWMPRVRWEERDTHQESIRKEGFSQYQITERRGESLVPAGRRKQYFPVIYIEPWDEHQSLFGFDLGSLPECLAAMNRAEARLGPAIGYYNIPGLDGESEPTIYMFEDAHTETLVSREDVAATGSSDGFIMGVLHLREVVGKALELLQSTGVDVYLFDVSNPEKPISIFSHPSRIRHTPLPDIQSPPTESSAGIHYAVRIPVADRMWLVYCVPTDVYLYSMSKWGPAAALLVGLVMTGLIVGYLFLLIGRTARIENLVAQRTQELQASEKRFRILVENAADSFLLHDENGRILDVNQSACEHLGYSREELLTMNVFDFEVAFKRENYSQDVWSGPVADSPVDIPGIHRRKDGSTYPVDVRLSYLEIAGKRLVLALVRDVTERKQAEEAIRKEQRFLRHLIDLQERERKLMAYEIHDGLAQQLTGALFKLQAIGIAQEKQDLPGAGKILDGAIRLIRESVDEARRLISGLRPPILDESGIIAAIAYLCSENRKSGGPQIEFVHQVQFHRLASPQEVALFRITQECLTNACRYSQSPNIRVELRQPDNHVLLIVRDWGIGFDPREVKENRFGLRGIRERVRLLGGAADIDSTPGKGTTITVQLPLDEGDIEEDENE